MKKKDKAGDLVGFLLYLCIGAGLFTYFQTNDLSKSFFVFIVAFAVVFIFFAVKNARHNAKLKEAGIEEIDMMDGLQFEEYLDQLFKSLGYKSKITSYIGDFGADLILTSKDKNKIIAVQAKRYSKNVGIKAIQEVIGSIAHYKVNEGWVVTNSYFTKQAVHLAASNKVTLINRDELIKLILKAKQIEEAGTAASSR